MTISIFDLFKIGIGPSSSHTVGPMKAARQFAETLQTQGTIAQCKKLTVELFGSLGATGEGHGTPKAIILGLEGDSPESVDVASIENRIQQIKQTQILTLLRNHEIDFDYSEHLILNAKTLLPFHPNGMRFSAMDDEGILLLEKCYYSVGGGFVVEESVHDGDSLREAETRLMYPFTSALELLEHCKQAGLPISQIIWANEKAWRSDAEINQQLDSIWESMQACIDTGCESEGYLPGGLNVRKRAARLYRELKSKSPEPADPLNQLDWVTVFA